MNRGKPQTAKSAATPALTPESVRSLQRRVRAFAATGTTSTSPVTYHR